MSNPKFSTGDIRSIDGHVVLLTSGTGERIATCHAPVATTGDRTASIAEAQANARLFAQAHRMFGLLKKARNRTNLSDQWDNETEEVINSILKEPEPTA